MAVAPFQLWLDLAPVASASRASSTVTITTTTAHGLTSGAWVQVAGTTGSAGTSMVGIWQVTVTSSTQFTYTAAGTAGSATVTSAWIANDLLNPPINFTSGADRRGAMVVPLESLQMSANGDGSGSAMSFDVLQEQTPASGCWFLLIPDNARVRLCQANTGTAPVAADVRFLGVVASLDSSLTGSGQGSTTKVTLGDANYVLDRLAVFGKPGASRSVNGSKFSVNTTTNVCTVTFGQDHGFVQGQPIKVGGVMQAGTNGGVTGIRRVKTVPDARTITYDVDAGTTNTAQTSNQVSYARIGTANDRIAITGRYADLNLLDGDTVSLSPVNGMTTELARLVRNTFSGKYVTRAGANTLHILLPVPYTGVWGTFTGYGGITTKGYVSDTRSSNELMVTIPGGSTEDQAVEQVLAAVHAYKADDSSVQRVIDTSATDKIVGNTTYKHPEAIQFASTTLRAALDTIVETYAGDGKERRFFIGLDGKLNYLLVDPASKPALATAPLAITTDSGAGDPDSTSKATVAPFDLSVTWDHDITKQVMMTIPSTSGLPFCAVNLYSDIKDADDNQIFPTRAGAIYDAVVDYPTAVKSPAAQISRAAIAYLTERHKPLLSGSFTLRGGGGQTWNEYGFSAGYAATAGSPVLVSRWEPGQWVEVVCATLGLSGLYRVEEVTWSLETGSYMQIITVTFNRKNPSDFAALIAAQR